MNSTDNEMFLRNTIPTLLFLLLATALNVAAQESDPLVTDRPDQTESATTVAPGKVQIEMGGSVEIDTLEANAQRDLVVISAPDLLVRIGLAERLELRVGTAFTRTSYDQFDPNSPGGVGTRFTSSQLEGHLGGKVSIHENVEEGSSSALFGGVNVPIAGDGGTYSAEIRASIAQEVSSIFSLGLNLGGTWEEGGTLGGFYTLVAGIGLSESFGTFVELYGDMPWQDDAAQSFDTGLTWGVSDNLQLDIAAGFGLNRSAADAMAGLGFSWRLPE